MITENKHRDNKRNHGGLQNDVQQNRGMDADYPENSSEEKPNDFVKPVDNGGVKSSELEPHLEEEWHAVRDEYLSHYPGLEDVNTNYEDGSFSALIDRLAEKHQRTPQEIQHEILNWNSIKN
ncbi:hypothetical protein [Zobellia alginiliquefaciens]|uniref:hypothetical protein n=1 Tax=Zobellia alginiliquefaciens TaxID=3032586 RepID=UPI0023E3CF1A|nr:hypothetical protein [Zobellia alginiliquefaciens]